MIGAPQSHARPCAPLAALALTRGPHPRGVLMFLRRGVGSVGLDPRFCLADGMLDRTKTWVETHATLAC
jgi:hypothetical protein